MTPVLLDVNVLVALVWPEHDFHEAVEQWFGRRVRHGWVTCAFTQTALIRLLSNPSFSSAYLTPANAVEVLRRNIEHPQHHFWRDEIPVEQAFGPLQKLSGHRQVTDAYLLGLAIHHKGRFATLDRGILSLLPSHSPHRSMVELISG